MSLSCALHIFVFLVVFLLSSLKIAMDSLRKLIVIGIAVLWASFSFLDFSFGCGCGCGSCKYIVLRSESVCRWNMFFKFLVIRVAREISKMSSFEYFMALTKEKNFVRILLSLTLCTNMRFVNSKDLFQPQSADSALWPLELIWPFVGPFCQVWPY